MKIEVYGQSWCPYCDRARDLLEERELEYEYRDVGDDEKLVAEMKERSNGYQKVPQVFIDGEFIGGYDELRSRLKKV